MGLSLAVGMLADLVTESPEEAARLRTYFERLNGCLRSLNLLAHQEPETCDSWSADMYGYSGLHYLRRFAAHEDATGKLPVPGDGNSSEDPVLNAYFDDVIGKKPRLISRLTRRGPKFERKYDHLIVHSDAEGFYLPVDFKEVLFPPEELEIPGAMVGSVPRLLDELSRLGRLLGIPETMNSQSDELWEAVDNQGEGEELWQRYAIESFSCVVLREGCQKSLASGAALVFC